MLSFIADLLFLLFAVAILRRMAARTVGGHRSYRRLRTTSGAGLGTDRLARALEP
jgi:hypothetical protein